MSAAWVSWVMLVLLVLLAFNRFFITDLLVVFRGMFSRSERLYLDTTWQGRVMAWLFRAGVIAMAVYLLITRELGACNFVGYLVTLGLIGVYLLVQYGLESFVSVVFLSGKQKELVFEQRGCICNAMMFVLWLVVLVIQWVDNTLVMKGVCMAVAVVYVLLLLLKGVQLLYKNVLSVLYVLVSIISLEVVPWVVTISVIKHMLQ
jgi:hypothetical protein